MKRQRAFSNSARNADGVEDQRASSLRHCSSPHPYKTICELKSVRFDMKLSIGKGARGDEDKSNPNRGNQSRERILNKLLRKLRSDPVVTPSAAYGRATSRPESSWSVRRRQSCGGNGRSASYWNVRSCGRPRCLADLKSMPLMNVKSEDSLRNEGAHAETPSHQRGYARDDSSRQLNLLWEGEGGEESRSRLFSSLVNIENYDHDSSD